VYARAAMANATPAPHESLGVRLAEGTESSAPAASAGAAGAADWLRSARKSWDAVTRFLASSRVSAGFFSALPALFSISVVVYVNVGLAADLNRAACLGAGAGQCPNGVFYNMGGYNLITAITGALNYFVGVFTGVTLVCSLANLLALWRQWPGVLSFWNWVVVVLKDWLLVTFAIVLCVWRSTFFSVAGFFT